jgi:hypothetical protein
MQQCDAGLGCWLTNEVTLVEFPRVEKSDMG